MTPHDDVWSSALAATLREVAAARSPAEVARAVEGLLLDHVGGRARCWFYDAESGTPWAADDGDAPDPEVGAAARVPQARIVGMRALQAVHGTEVHGVLDVEAGGPAACARLVAAARQLAPLFEYHARASELHTPPDAGPFRSEALEAHYAPDAHGAMLVDASPWVARCYRALVGLAIAALGYTALARISDWSVGPAIVRLEGRREVAAGADGVVAEVLVAPGDRVVAGQPLVRLDAPAAAADRARAQLAFELQLRNLLRDPGDAAARQAVTELRAEKARTEAALDAFVLRSADDAVVADVRTAVGQAVTAGVVLVSLLDPNHEGGAELVALLPGDQRPRIHPGMELRVAIDGYAGSSLTVDVAQVDEDVVGAAEAERLVGAAVTDGASHAPVTRVRARLPARFGPGYAFHDGMRGEAQIRVRSVPVLAALIPALAPWEGP